MFFCFDPKTNNFSNISSPDEADDDCVLFTDYVELMSSGIDSQIMMEWSNARVVPRLRLTKLRTRMDIAMKVIKVLDAMMDETQSERILQYSLTEAARRRSKGNRKKNKSGGSVSPGHARGRKSKYTGMMIELVRPENHRRRNSHGFRSVQLILDAGGKMSYDDFIAAGGRNIDIDWDIKFGHAKASNS